MAKTISWSVRKAFYEQASAQLENGLPMTTVLQNFQQRLVRQRKKYAAEVFETALVSVRNGASIVEALSRHLTDTESGLLEAGEKSGETSQSMQFIVETKERERRIIGKVRSSMITPLVYATSGFAVLYFIGSSVVPQFAQIVPPEKWNGSAALMRNMGEFATGFGMPIFIVALIALMFGLFYSLPRYTGKIRDVLDRRIPPYSIYKELSGVIWLTAFISMVRSGVVNVHAIETQIKSANPWLASRLIPVRNALRNGDSLFDAIKVTGINFPSADMLEEIGAYASFPDFAAKLSVVVRAYTDKFETRMVRIGAVVSTVFTMWMFGIFLVIQLGANDLSSLAASSTNF